MKILGIDTSLNVATVSILEDEKILGELSVSVENKHSETLMPIIKALMDITKVNPTEIERVICGVGPGSFTGLRIGVATAKAFAYSNNINVIPVSTLDILCTNIKYTNKLIVPLIDGKRGNVYTATYKLDKGVPKRQSNMMFTTIDGVLEDLKGKDVIFLGDGAITYKDLILENKFEIANNKDLLCNATNMSLYANSYLIEEEVNVHDLKPIYLRKSQAERDYILKNIDSILFLKMNESHINEVYEIEKNTFPKPWSKEAFTNELSNKLATYYVGVFEGEVVAYGGLWVVSDSANITNIAVAEEYKKMGIGKNLVLKLIDCAKENKCIGVTLEVRVSNNIAISLYESIGFKVEGKRKKFYSDNNEDAYVMWLKF